MAKKKTVETANIKAAPVLRAGSGGEQPTPETPVITKSYSVRDDWKDKGVVNYVAFKSVDGEVQDLTVNGEPAGGGGIRTAQVTFKNTGQMPSALNLPILAGEYTQVLAAVIPPTGTDMTIDSIVLGPTGCESNFDETPSTGTATGGVSYDAGYVQITGDGTLTIS